MRQILLSLCFSVFSLVWAANADENETGYERWGDATCKDVVRASFMTEIYPSYSYEMHLIREDGTYRPFIEKEFTPTEDKEKRHFEKEWRSNPRLYYIEWSFWNRNAPTLTNCKLIGTEAETIGEVNHYRMNWTKAPYRGEMDAWISKDHQLLTRVTLRSLDDRWSFPEEKVAFLYKYNDLSVSSPLRIPEPLESSTSCDRVRQTSARANETQAIYMTVRIVNNGFGEPYLARAVLDGPKQYSRSLGLRWKSRPRLYTNPESIRKCKLLGFQEVDGLATSVYEYERPDGDDGEFRILYWISDATHLPVKAHFMRLKPANGEEFYVTYAYNPVVKEPN